MKVVLFFCEMSQMSVLLKQVAEQMQQQMGGGAAADAAASEAGGEKSVEEATQATSDEKWKMKTFDEKKNTFEGM